jgi:hypothetical protein
MSDSKSTLTDLEILEQCKELTPERQAQLFHLLSPEAREQLVTVTENPENFLRRISPEDIYFTVRHLEPENSMSIISACSVEQLLYVLDLELWRRDVLDPKASQKWIELITLAGFGKIAQFLEYCDPELVVAVMNNLIDVTARNFDTDLIEQMDDLRIETLEDLFLIYFKDPDSEFFLRTFFDSAFAWNPYYYLDLMSSLALGLKSDYEELALKWKKSRLYDHGFPDLEDAVQVYLHTQRNAILSPKSDDPARNSEPFDDCGYGVDYCLRVIADRSIFTRAIESICDDTTRDVISLQLAHLANKVIIADNKDPGSLDDIMKSLRKIAGCINMAVEEACGDDVNLATAAISINHLELLFRRGFSLITELRNEAKELLGRFSLSREDVGHPLSEILDGLFSKRPFLAAGVLGEKVDRDFSTINDIIEVRNLMNRLITDDVWEPL